MKILQSIQEETREKLNTLIRVGGEVIDFECDLRIDGGLEKIQDFISEREKIAYEAGMKQRCSGCQFEGGDHQVECPYYVPHNPKQPAPDLLGIIADIANEVDKLKSKHPSAIGGVSDTWFYSIMTRLNELKK